MNWQEVCERSDLRNLPFKIELNAWGQILMSPIKAYHSAFRGQIARLLPREGVVLAECAIKTAQDTKVADIAWCSSERFRHIREETECSVAPEVCIEIQSASNSDIEMAEKIGLYLAAGAVEVWLCDLAGDLSFSGRMTLTK
ncbi:putative restriction endonuclease domain-containing protein [Gammaproteobacteria bacterium]